MMQNTMVLGKRSAQSCQLDHLHDASITLCITVADRPHGLHVNMMASFDCVTVLTGLISTLHRQKQMVINLMSQRLRNNKDEKSRTKG